MVRWQKIEIIHNLTTEYRYLGYELMEMQACWKDTASVDCSPACQNALQDKLDELCARIKVESIDL